MDFAIYSLGLVALILGGLLIPRLRFIGDLGPDKLLFIVRNPWFRFIMNLSDKSYNFSILFMKLYDKSQSKMEAPEPSGETSAPKHDYHPEMETVPEMMTPPLIPPLRGRGGEMSENNEKDRELEAGAEIADSMKSEPPPVSEKYKKQRIKRQFRKFKFRSGGRTKTEEKKIFAGFFWQEKELIITLARRIIENILRTFRIPRLDRLNADLLIATPDPALTGILYGIAWQTKALHHPPKRIINIRSDFDLQNPSAEIAFSFSIVPLVLMVETAYMMVRLPWWRIYKSYRRLRKLRKQDHNKIEV